MLEHAEEAELHLAGGQVSTAGAVAAAFPLAVSLHRLGDYSLKGVEEPVRVVQFLPQMLEGRLNHFVPPAVGGKVGLYMLVLEHPTCSWDCSIMA
jgi:hypothetical protein